MSDAAQLGGTKVLNLTHTIQALVEYDAQREDRLHNVSSQEWEGSEEAALRAVRLAFYLDTGDRNSLENCMYAQIAWLRELIAVRR